jgi:tRNA pseudouridine synthase 10
LVDSSGALLLKEYQLCRHCLARQAGAPARKQAEKCYICRGMMGSLDNMAKEVLAATEPYEFDTFLVGATLPTQMYEREDALRARLKIRGRESIKSQLTRELGLRLSRLTGKKVDYMRPDIAINVGVERDGATETAVRARPIAVEGRYTKKERGLPQKQEKCPMCLGKGCNLCDNSGLAGFASIEGIIAKYLLSATKGQSPKFSWIGSEDQSSLVLGRGRPFYAKISDPKVRRPKVRFSEAGVAARITAIMDDVPDTQARLQLRRGSLQGMKGTSTPKTSSC